MDQNIIQIGNSAGIIIPKALLEQAGLEPGTQVVIEQNTSDNSLIIIKKGAKSYKSTVTPEFVELLEKVNDNYGKALKELSER